MLMGVCSTGALISEFVPAGAVSPGLYTIIIDGDLGDQLPKSSSVWGCRHHRAGLGGGRGCPGAWGLRGAAVRAMQGAAGASLATLSPSVPG